MKENTKDWFQYASAGLLIISAIVLAFVSFIITLTVGGGVLAYCGEAFGVALAIFGVTAYFRNQLVTFETKVDKRLRELKKEND